MRRKSIQVLSCALLLGAAAPALAQDDAPPSPDAVRQKVNEVMQWYRALPAEERSMPALQSKFDETFAEVDFSQFGIDELKAVPLYYAGEELRGKITARIDELKARDDAEGAAAWAMSLDQSRAGGPDAVAEAFSTTVNHPGLREAIAKGWALEVFNFIAAIPEEARESVKEDVVALAAQFEADLPPMTMTNAVSYMTALADFGDVIDPAVREETRATLVTAVQAAADEAAAEAGEDAQKKQLADYLADSVTFLDGAFARGQLVGHEAPAVHITWFSGDDEVASLADFKGKVVVLDFWATWCGPCVASFPNIRELQERYNGYDVAIIGVTSLQGRHFPELGQPPIDCEGDPQKEYDLMREYITAKDLTWHVVFTEENVFNPDFGVRGIPHMAILGADGVVRYRGLHPAGSTLAEKAEKIDGLLKEAGLPTPPPLSTDTDDGE